MFPINGFVFICNYTNRWGESISVREEGPFKVLEYFELYSGSEMYYDLEGTNVFYRYEELRPATKVEELYDKLTQHIKV